MSGRMMRKTIPQTLFMNRSADRCQGAALLHLVAEWAKACKGHGHNRVEHRMALKDRVDMAAASRLTKCHLNNARLKVMEMTAHQYGSVSKILV